MALSEKINGLIELFDRNIDAYKSGIYNETEVRHEFIDPFFIVLGWDVNNEQGYAEAFKDVIHEDSIKVGGVPKAPDYCFRIGGTRKFFLEAKKPSVNLKEDTHPAYQLRRYAWSAKLPLSILTDFEEFAVYDCRVRPVMTDKPSTARVFYCTFREYLRRWDWINDVFSKDAILKGSFDKYVESSRAKKGTAEVDRAFLKEIESWREKLARTIALRNPALSRRELNFAVQRTIDRIIFLRICEDRGIEDYGALMNLLNGSDIYGRLRELYYRADERYNSGLFHFRDEKGFNEPPDEMTLSLIIDDKPLKDIISNLYYPDSPYEFSVLPADILGQVYEQFLGKIIRLTAGHRAVVEDKPEVKKAGGVYYTPTYIVDYIVGNTVGKLLDGATPDKASSLRILDPACGSGSFLIGAYQRLLDWHLRWYTENDPEKWAKARKPRLFRGPSGDWRLTTDERKRILLNTIYGVDIDPQAVEVTKLSLLLKVLEGESGQTLTIQYRLFHERALPNLGENIKCGNSLIGPDFYDGKQMNLFDEEERYRINVFDWKAEFPEIMRAGGFDAVIGNPPYIPIETMTESEKIYYQIHHQQLERKYDSSIIFILAMITKLNKYGRLGFISSITWQTGENYSKLRELLFNEAGIIRLINLPFDVFKNAYVDTGIYILCRKITKSYEIFRFQKKMKVTNIDDISLTSVSRDLIQPPQYKIILDPIAHNILKRVSLLGSFKQLDSFTISTQGLAGNLFEVSESPLGDEWYPFLEKGQARRYFLDIDKRSFANMVEKKSLKRFYESHPKLLIRRVISRQDRLLVAYTNEKLVFKKDINPFLLNDKQWNIFFVLGILNSRLISYLYVNTSSISTKDDFRQTTLAELRRLPIPIFNEKEKSHTRIVVLVEQLLSLQMQIVSASIAHDREVIQRQIDATDMQIDTLVYELYELTEEEKRIVEAP